MTSGARHGKPKQKKTAGDYVRGIILFVAIIVFAVSGTLLVNTLYVRWKAKDEAKGVQQIARPDIGNAAGGVIAEYKPLSAEALAKLKAINGDFVAWITIPGTNIDYPVVQGKDNSKYLNTTFEGNHNAAGSIFMGYEYQADLSDLNTVVYGHHMKNQSMFQNLKLYKDKDNFQKLRYIYVQRETGEVYKYEVFSAYETDANYDYRQPNYATDEEIQSFFDRITKKSKFDAGIKLTPNDRIVTLSTCDYDFSDARLAVHGRLVSIDGKPALRVVPTSTTNANQ